MIKLVSRALLLAALSAPLHAADQVRNAPTTLHDEIAALDARMFDAFNRQDFESIKAIFSTDLEFFHDTAGLSNYEENLQATRALFASSNKLRRELIAGSMQVYPIQNYGAIQTGVHRFCHIEHGKDDCGTFQFLHIWKHSPAGWRLARVVSYGH